MWIFGRSWWRNLVCHVGRHHGLPWRKANSKAVVRFLLKQYWKKALNATAATREMCSVVGAVDDGSARKCSGGSSFGTHTVKIRPDWDVDQLQTAQIWAQLLKTITVPAVVSTTRRIQTIMVRLCSSSDSPADSLSSSPYSTKTGPPFDTTWYINTAVILECILFHCWFKSQHPLSTLLFFFFP